jgi:predicted transcriptional regulator
MRKRADWMVPIDEPILEYIRTAGEVNPAVVGRNIGTHQNYAGERCRKLAIYGLLNRFEDGYYSITDLGEQFLDGELDAGTLEPDD